MVFEVTATISLENMGILGPTPDLLNKKLLLSKIPSNSNVHDSVRSTGLEGAALGRKEGSSNYGMLV